MLLDIYIPPEYKEKYKKLNEQSLEFLEETLQEFCERAIIKFIDGQKQHGGVIYNRPMMIELDQEIIDIVFYSAGIRKRKELGKFPL